jgi:hypothetical protein
MMIVSDDGKSSQNYKHSLAALLMTLGVQLMTPGAYMMIVNDTTSWNITLELSISLLG